MPKVSVIIPVYNVEKYLRQCLDSVVNQTLSDIEIICVDDCSTDSSLSILREYAKDDERIKIVSLEENCGLGNARNVGIKHSLSNYIMYVDSDDWLELNACELAYNQIYKNKDDFVYFNIQFYFEDDSFSIDNKRLKPFLSKFSAGQSFSFKDLDSPFMGYAEAWYKIYLKSFIIDNNLTFSTVRFAEDMPFYVNCVVAAKSVSVIDTPLYNYRQRKGSIITNTKNYPLLLQARREAYNAVLKSEDTFYITNYLIAHINSLTYWFETWTSVDKQIAKDFYYLLKQEFSQLEQNHSINDIKAHINYSKFKFMIKHSYISFCVSESIVSFIRNIFSIRNEYKGSKKIKVLMLVGVKIILKTSN